ncbi:zonular occludens toxin domain-containing protein [Xanthomonas albilineans]|uniref:zonular occludens toxin domain-containing protein n=1 Tax=Xanthomonas albilineans TaxID=29447 RepID=UPI00280AD7E4|nr:zonular occludens toxin domain-containing protein [Xanthomonas albilineans]
MIVGKEGQPRSGKSYETVKYDIVEAIKAKRRIYARINGLDHDKIAAYLGMPVDDVRDLLIVMDDDQVHAWLVCDTQADGSLNFPHLHKGALVVVDEVHEYWPTGRAPIPKANADFFAKHGHIGLDVVLMTQDFKEVHRSVIRRMQRKNVYTKLDALGKDDAYSIRFYTAAVAGKFELTGSEKRNYDPDIWPLYHGIQPGTDGNAVYKTGSRTIWQTAKKPAIAIIIALVIGIYFILRFFTGAALPDSAKQQVNHVKNVVSQQRASLPSVKPQQSIAPVTPISPVKQRDTSKDLPPGVRYIVDLAASARPRYAGSFGAVDVVEFRATGGGQVLDRFTTAQLWALGWYVDRTAYGALLRSKDREIIATSWPVDDDLGQQSVQTTERIHDAAGPPVTSASETQTGPAAGLRGASIPHQSRALGSFPENKPYKSETATPATTLAM